MLSRINQINFYAYLMGCILINYVFNVVAFIMSFLNEFLNSRISRIWWG